jgi:glycosyltransferase involved in cell wall biosynthesis
MKIAIISHEGGGISSVTSGLSRSLAKKGIKTTVFTGAHSKSRQTIKLSDHLEFNYLPILNLPPRNYWFQALNLRTLLKELKDYDVIHGMSVNASFFLSLFKNKLGAPFVSTLHEDLRTSQRAFVNLPISSWTFKEAGFFLLEFPFYDIPAGRVFTNSDHITFCSYSLLKQVAAYRKIDYNKVTVIHNGLDFDEIDGVPDEPADDEDAISVVFAGRLMRVKGALLLIEAFRRLGKDFCNVHLKIFGRGPSRNVLEKKIVKYGLKDKVFLMGQVPHKKLISEIKKSHFVVFPSLNEAQPMFVLEAMACKKPVIAFDFPFAREIINHMDTGLLAKAGDVDDLSMKIKLLANDADLRLKLCQAGRNYVRKEHDWAVQVEKYVEVYERAMDLG